MDSINVAIISLKPSSHRIKNMINFFWSKTKVATGRVYFFASSLAPLKRVLWQDE